MATRNIEINYKTNGGYDILYPNITARNVIDFNDDVNLILKNSTKALYSLGNEAVPDDVFKNLGNYIATATKVESGSYVGTGTTWESNANSLTFPFAPKAVLFLGYSNSGGTGWTPFGPNGAGEVPMAALTTEYKNSLPPWWGLNSGRQAYAKRSSDGKTLSWYNYSANGQLNLENYIYYYVAIG